MYTTNYIGVLTAIANDCHPVVMNGLGNPGRAG
jgi:hypothetical protein